MILSRFITFVVPGALLGGGLLSMCLGACSLGETDAQDCDPNAAPNSANACTEVARCDDGNGGIDTSADGCCAECAVLTYEKCVGKQISVLEEFCGINKPGDPSCCTVATLELTACETGGKVDCDPSTQHNPGNSNATAAGSGGNGAGGSAAGGSAMGGSAMGGSGGS